MAMFKEAQNRLFKDIYVCKKCKSKFRSRISKFLIGKCVCRSCKCKNVRPVRLKSKN